jgi:NADPH:quinone reductase-like Zn-dependent oxidoreductase
VPKQHHHCENNELSELSVLGYKEQQFMLCGNADAACDSNSPDWRSRGSERREELGAFASELFSVVASGRVRINVNPRFALKNVADAHKALEARVTSSSIALTI